MWRKINSWRGRALCKAGKDVMIKSVLQAIPSYIMSIYLIPDSIINDIERMLNSFWWGGGTNNKGIRWLAWDKLARPKADGGLGFRNFHAFNMAMVAKQAWNFMSKPNTLVARIYKARWKIGDGSRINIMSEPWLRGEDNPWMQAPQNHTSVAESIIRIPLLEEVTEDCLLWQFENNGNYTVKSGYKTYLKNREIEQNYTLEKEWGSSRRASFLRQFMHFNDGSSPVSVGGNATLTQASSTHLAIPAGVGASVTLMATLLQQVQTSTSITSQY
ncbi:unnamed protein product [Trifolium pratense]|uniref:Uncharacterized protein n=1 Tax=Trifolium pratense TaxID=57577 RepID=A0ACB0L989_TRIPR|nr:unnamed protein product [Trifolium pratense]